jgi:hypothetical protein
VWFFISTAGFAASFSVVNMPGSFLGQVFGVTMVICVTIYAWEVVVVNLLLNLDSKMSD